MIDLLIQKYYRPPFIGLMAFIMVFVTNPISHATVVAVKDLAGPGNGFLGYQIVAAAAIIALVWGIKRNTEVAGTLIGFVSGMLLWACWASYAFKFNPISLGMPKYVIGADGYSRGANLLFIQGSIGICGATLLFFIFNKDTKCNAFRWIQRALRLDLGEPASGQGRNYCRITFLETIYVIWFCYAASLFLGDERFLGYHHPVTYAVFATCILWGGYLLWKLSKFTRVMAGIRYAVPVRAIVWLGVGELAPKYGFYEEIWLDPLTYTAEIWTIVGVFVVLILASAWMPQRRVRNPVPAAQNV
ncbi:MAG: hypothetical protein JNM81_00655 [Rhodospirillaceae bacterium]|nr:hypothetical protein [Rhodospirillaceae bacterium]